ncbi:MAG: fibronectin type III domain-containing protein [Candidatus Thermoplasmatota archaeon]|nr:fibronectin type III domain-containing protein [Candidatus Thermoplasmatota archaeon]
MRSVALVIVIFSLLAAGFGMIGALAVPSAPGTLVATAGVGQVGLTWQAASFEPGYPITNYRVFRGTSPGTAVFLANAGTSLSYTDNAVMAGQIYYYQVSAENSVGEGPRSNEDSATPTAPSAPTAPRNLQAAEGVVQVSLTWQAPLSDGGSPVTNYVVYRDTAPGAAFFLADAGTLLTYTDTAVMAGQIYYYQVSANNTIGESLTSNVDSATPTATATAPSAPQNLVATAGAGQVGLTWQAPLSDGGSPLTNYVVYRDTAPGAAVFLANAGTLLTYTDTAVMTGQTYYYQVSAENTVGEGPRSNEAVVMPEVEIEILAPGAGQTISTLGFRLQVSVANFTLDPASIGQADNPGHGHYHVWVNDSFTGVLSGDPIVDLSNFPVGPMKLGVELVTNMHASLSPAVWDNITVTVVAPSIALTDPADGSTVGTQGPRFQVDVQGLELDSENLGGNPIPGHGHYHVFVDGSFTGTTPTESTFTIPSFTPGSHTVKVDLRTNNHQLLSPTVEDTITVTAADPSISIVEPTAGATVGTVVFLQVQIAGFIIDAESVGQASVPGRGHYHVTVDGTTIDFAVTGLIYPVKDLAEGDHTIQVSLHNNDHSPLSPEVTDQVTVTVELAAPPPPPPAGIDPVVFAGTSIGLIVLLIVVAVALILWGRRGRQAP